MARSALLNVMVNAALKAGRGLARDFGEIENLQVSLKGPGNFVSAADHRAEGTLVAELKKARPGYAFLTEESGVIDGTDTTHRWIIDPLDGTTNFLHGIPLFSISLALERDGQIVAGVVYNPVMNELYTTERGAGAFLNDRRLRVAGRKSLADAVVCTGAPNVGIGTEMHVQFLAEMKAMMAKTAGVRRLGSAAIDLAWVASGRLDGFWERGLKPWDMAAGLLLIREAGGRVTGIAGKDDALETGQIVAGNETMHAALLRELAAATA
ncbi:MAG TPA: inositol monophosphatase family protein [Bauldia sp.]|nr:inositol monophosphatase family protein [Bauldia sp.]